MASYEHLKSLSDLEKITKIQKILLDPKECKFFLKDLYNLELESNEKNEKKSTSTFNKKPENEFTKKLNDAINIAGSGKGLGGINSAVTTIFTAILEEAIKNQKK